MRARALAVVFVLLLAPRLALAQPAAPTPTATLYERLGGAPGVAAFVGELAARNAANPITAKRLASANRARIRQGLLDLVGERAGGPERYAGTPMTAAHAGMGITDAEFDAFVGNVAAAAEKVGFAPRERAELVAIFEGLRGEVVARTLPAEERLARLEAELVALERRLGDLEAALREGGRAPPVAPPAPPPPFSPEERKLVPELVARYRDGENARDGGDRQELVGRRLAATRFAVASGGGPVDLRDYEGKKRVVLVILRGFGGTVCIHCSAQTLALADAMPEFRKRDAEVILVYPGRAESAPAFVAAVKGLREGFEPPFPIVLDTDLVAVRTFRIEGNLAKPTAIILDEQGVVRFAHVGRQPADRPSAKELLDVLDRIRAPAGTK
jgi:hemoglobin